MINYKKILISPWSALITLALVVFIRVEDPTFVESIRLRYFDTLITSKAPTENNIYTVNIDEESLNKYGQWPLPRAEYAKIIRELYSRNAGLVVLNVLMFEPDRTGGDNVLGATMSQYPVILGNTPTASVGKNIPRKPGLVVIGPHDPLVPTYPNIIANVSQLENNAIGVGTTNMLPEIDGVNRRIPLITQVKTKDGHFMFPSLAMEILRVAAGDTTQQVKLNEYGIEKMRIPKFGPISTDNSGRIWIDWSQKSKQASLVNLPKDFEGAVVIIGPTAAGIANPVPTATGAVFSQDLQAAVVGTMFNQVVIQRPDWADGAELLAILLAGVILLFLTRWVYAGLASVVGLVAVFAYGSYFSFVNYLWLFDITGPIAGVVLVALHAYGIKFVSEYLQKQQIKKQFGSYVNPTIVESLQKDPSLIKLGGERKELSIVMTDLRGFTSLGESFGDDVEGLTQIMNDYMTALSVPVLSNDGTLIKFIGDASLHVHGAPLDDPNHAKTAVKTALGMIKAIEEFNVGLVASGRPPVGMGAGVNTGETLIGNIGAKTKFGYDVLGDSVSTAARLEGQTKGYGVLCIIGPNTYNQVKDEYVCLELDNIAVKGKTIGLQIYVPLGLASELNIPTGDIQMHVAMLELYRQQKFDTAIKFCNDLKGRFNGVMDHYYEIWIERCEEMKNVKLPADWDGIFRATSK
jgi:adenylate cyclase